MNVRHLMPKVPRLTPRFRQNSCSVVVILAGLLPHNPLAVGSSPTRPTQNCVLTWGFFVQWFNQFLLILMCAHGVICCCGLVDVGHCRAWSAERRRVSRVRWLLVKWGRDGPRSVTSGELFEWFSAGPVLGESLNGMRPIAVRAETGSRVRGREKVLGGGQVEVPVGGQ
jgi:hypothetical protein